MVSERINRMKEKQRNTVPTFSAERARLATEAYEKFGGEPNVLLKAKMLDYIVTNMTVYIDDDDLIAGNYTDRPRCAPIFPEFASQWILDEIDTFTTRTLDQMTAEDGIKEEVIEILKRWEGKSFDEVTAGVCRPEAIEAMNSGILSIGGLETSTGHILPNYFRLFDGGLASAIQACEKNIKEMKVAKKEDQEKVDFWNAVIISCSACIKFAHRFSVLAKEMAAAETDEGRKQELLVISENCATVPENSPQTFWQAIQFVWFIHITLWIESNGHANSFPVFDRLINPLYVKDLQEGNVTEREALDILECFFIKNTDILKLRNAFFSESWAGYPVWQNMIIGGIGADGKDACNEATMLLLKANEEVQSSQPTMSLRYHRHMSKAVFDKAISMIQKGLATPAFFNDHLCIPLVLAKSDGINIEDARNWGVMGCVQPMAAGKSDGRAQVGTVNLLKCIEFAMHDGFDPQTGKQTGPHTGKFEEFASYEDFFQAFLTQVDHSFDLMINAYNSVTAIHATRQNMPFASMCVDDCIAKGTTLQQGGAKYSYSGALADGLANAIDSLAAVRKFVFEDKILTAQELLSACDDDFADEVLRQKLLNKGPKYGNDIDEVDLIGHLIIKHINEMISTYRDSRGARFCFDIESQSYNIVQGKCVGATPDGRKAFAPLGDNVSPVMGRDISGPTATVLSVAKIDQFYTTDGTLFNIRFDPRSIAGEKGREVLGGVVKTYFDNYGEHIQINVVSDETLREAQKHPEDYKNLLVRVAGYLAYFTELDKNVQDNIIARTLHSCDC
ncbi:4-hydroxyphenylacetate decarboxylase large subunit [uncultured Eubacterium sp.]|nr:4-hydroxyphenylacetate decarboxylase large subunit [uncultured Eubacterium sp.]